METITEISWKWLFRAAAAACAVALAASCEFSGGNYPGGSYDGNAAWLEIHGTVVNDISQPVGGIRVSYADPLWDPIWYDSDSEGRFELKGNFSPSPNVVLTATDLGDGQNWENYMTTETVVSLYSSEDDPDSYYADGVVITLMKDMSEPW